jgi:hypothetical protein
MDYAPIQNDVIELSPDPVQYNRTCDCSSYGLCVGADDCGCFTAFWSGIMAVGEGLGECLGACLSGLCGS